MNLNLFDIRILNLTQFRVIREFRKAVLDYIIQYMKNIKSILCGNVLDLDLMKIIHNFHRRLSQLSVFKLHQLHLLTEKYPIFCAVERTPLNNCVHILKNFNKRVKPLQHWSIDWYELRSNKFQYTLAT